MSRRTATARASATGEPLRSAPSTAKSPSNPAPNKSSNRLDGDFFRSLLDLSSEVLYRRGADAVETTKRRPPLPIPPRLLPHLRRWRRLTAQFVIEYAGRPIASQERRAWRTARELAGLGSEVTPHVLRHTCATMLLQRGVSVYDVAGVLGTSEDVIRRTYGHHAEDHFRRAVAAFSRR